MDRPRSAREAAAASAGRKGHAMKSTPNRYEIFLKVAETGNISKAAESLHYTQSGVSHVIASLEEETGFRLFVRGKNGVSLTDNGRRLVPDIQAIVNSEQALRQSVFRINHQVAGKLRVGSFTSVTASWIPGMLKRFRDRWPEVELEIMDGSYDEINDWLLHGRVDCGFLSAPVSDRFLFHELVRDPLYAVMPDDHPLASKEAVSVRDLADWPFISAIKGCDNDTRALFEEAGLSVNVSYSLRDDVAILSFVRNHLGIAVLQKLVLDIHASGITSRPLLPERHRTIGLCLMPGRGSILCDLFLETLREMLRTESA